MKSLTPNARKKCYTILLATLLTGCEPPSLVKNPNRGLLDPIAQRAFEAVAEHTGANLRHVSWQLSNQKEVTDAYARAYEPYFRKTASDPDAARSLAQYVAPLRAQVIFAMYSSDDQKIHINKSKALQIGAINPETVESSYLALFVHEAGHAAADQLFNAFSLYERVDLPSQQTLLAALLEGHAQHITHKVCMQQDCLKAYRDVTDHITHVPGVDKHEDTLFRSETYFLYVDGEKFFRYATEQHGDEVIPRIFAEPPLSPWHIYRPKQYFSPPADRSTYDFRTAVDSVVQSFPQADWVSVQSVLTPRDLQNAFARIASNSTEVERLARGHIRDIVLTLEKKDQIGVQTIVVNLIEFDTERRAEFKVEKLRIAVELTSRDLLHAGKQKDHQGSRLVKHSYTELDGDSGKGFSRKAILREAGLDVPLSTMYAQRGRALAIMASRNSPLSSEEQNAILTRALNALITE